MNEHEANMKQQKPSLHGQPHKCQRSHHGQKGATHSKGALLRSLFRLNPQAILQLFHKTLDDCVGIMLHPFHTLVR